MDRWALGVVVGWHTPLRTEKTTTAPTTAKITTDIHVANQ